MRLRHILLGTMAALPAAAAQGGALSRVEDMVGTIFLANLTNPVWQKVLFFFLIFAVLYGAMSGLAAKSDKVGGLFKQKNLRLTLSVIISLISVLPLPAETLMSITLSYGAVAAFLLMLPPILAVIYLYIAIKDKEGGAKWPYAARIIILFLLSSILIHMGEAMAGFYEPFRTIADFAILISIILIFWNLFQLFGGGEGGWELGSLGGRDAGGPTGEGPHGPEEAAAWEGIEEALTQIKRHIDEFTALSERYLTLLQNGDEQEVRERAPELWSDIQAHQRTINATFETILNDAEFDRMSREHADSFVRRLSEWRQAYTDFVREAFTTARRRYHG